jgi:hypothetical protein
MIWSWKVALFVLLACIALAIGIALARVSPPMPEDKSTPPKADRTVVRTIQYVPQTTPPPVSVASRFADFIEPPVTPVPRAKPPEIDDEPERAIARERTSRHMRAHVRVRHASNDGFCARYGLRKVITRGGKSWRCRR